jgi:hypothetical protein
MCIRSPLNFTESDKIEFIFSLVIEETGNVGSITKEKINSILSDSVKLPQSVVTKSFTNTNNVCGYI